MIENNTELPLTLARAIAGQFGELPQVQTVALAGSQAAGGADGDSDIDLYVYLNAPVPVQARRRIATANAETAEVDNRFWEPGDEWIDTATGIHVDVMFRTMTWIEEQLDRILVRHEASVGYSTCLWHNVLSSQPLYDPGRWFQRLQARARQPYPEELRRAIVAKNHPILRQTASSYRYQLERAAARGDWVSINHRVSAMLASYFDILFAANRVPHPGEKRLLAMAAEQCQVLPADMGRQVKGLIEVSARGDSVSINHRLMEAVDTLVDGLDGLLSSEGFDLTWGQRRPEGGLE